MAERKITEKDKKGASIRVKSICYATITTAIESYNTGNFDLLVDQIDSTIEQLEIQKSILKQSLIPTFNDRSHEIF